MLKGYIIIFIGIEIEVICDCDIVINFIFLKLYFVL